jgi:mono/diheme cytochrome c family protein
VGSSQREATIVAIGLVIVATLVVVYLFNEENRREVAAEDKLEESAHRGVELYAQLCVACHGPDGMAEDRVGIPLNTAANQTDDETAWQQREPIIRRTIERGRGDIMPAWSQEDEGPLNPEQITDLVNMIHLGLWEDVEALVREQNNGELPTPPPPPTPSGETPTDPQAAAGQQLWAANCQTCHSVDGSEGTGPTWLGLYGREVTLEGGQTVTADDAYITESILNPTAKVVEGFQPVMPPFEGRLTDEQIQQIIAYMRTLSEDS